MKPMNIILAICGALLLILAYADRQEADEKSAQREAAVTKANAQRDARQVEWIDLDKVGRYMVGFDHIEGEKK